MKTRIIAGEFGGRLIAGSPNNRTHPMSERVRNALFNIVGDEIQSARVLDAFAGVGTIGLEALSRGAAQAILVEKDAVAVKVIKENIHSLHIEHAQVVKSPISRWIESQRSNQFDIIFADPPYHDVQFSTVMQLFRLLKPKGLMVLSHPGRERVPTEMGVVVVDNRSYGTAALAFYRHE